MDSRPWRRRAKKQYRLVAVSPTFDLIPLLRDCESSHFNSSSAKNAAETGDEE
jgi:hypothetical protein